MSGMKVGKEQGTTQISRGCQKRVVTKSCKKR